MTDDREQQPDPIEKSLGDQATGADLSRAEQERSLGDESTSGDALSSMSDLVEGLGEALDLDLPLIDLAARYQIEGELGQGGMGAVLLATDRPLKRKVAIKRILGSLTQSKTALQRFVTEAQSIAALNHFNIVQVYEFGRDAEGPLLVLEYVDGGSLLDRLKGGKLEVEEAVDITCQLCDGLAIAHEQGIIHRDIKPANILLTKRGEPKLTDFGLARQATDDDEQTKAGVVLGTIDYMSPEQRRDAMAVDARSDLWSLAATLYQMVTGKSPKVIRLDQLPGNLAPVIGKMLEEDPASRYQQISEFSDAIRATLQDPATAVTGTLQDGQCPACNNINDPNAKFCQKCGESLVEPCLICSEPVGLWATFCNQCGSNLTEALQQRYEQVTDQQRQIEQLRRAYRHPEAIEIAQQLVQLANRRFADVRSWAEQMLLELHSEVQQLQAEANQTLVLAEELFSKQDYTGAQQLLQRIKPALLTGRSSSLLTQAKQLEDEKTQLIQAIQQGMDQKQWSYLLPLVERYLQINPHSQNIRKLADRLRRQPAGKRSVKPQLPPTVSGSSARLPKQPSPSRPPPLPSPAPVVQTTSTSSHDQGQPRQDEQRSVLWVMMVGIVALALLVLYVGFYSSYDDTETPPASFQDIAGYPPVESLDEQEDKLSVPELDILELNQDFLPLDIQEQNPTVPEPDISELDILELNISELDIFELDIFELNISELDRIKALWLIEEVFKGHTDSVLSVAFSPDGKRIVSGSSDNTVRVWDANSGRRLQKLQGHTETVNSVALSPDGKRIVSGSDDNTLIIWDANSGKHLQTLRGHTGSVLSVAFSPDGKWIASGSLDNTLIIWGANSGKHLQTLRGHTGSVLSVAFSPDGKRIVSGSVDKTLRVWDANSGQPLQQLQGHTYWVAGVAFSPDRTRIASSSLDNTLIIWDANSGQELQTLEGHTENVISVAFSPDGKQIVSGSVDKTVRVWDANSGGPLQQLQGHTDSVWSVAFSPDGKWIVSGSRDKTVRIWDGDALAP